MREISKIQSSNFSKSQYRKIVVVLHLTLGSYDGAISWLTNSKSKASTNIIIGRMGQIAELVDIKKAAWHAGNVYKASERAKKILKKDTFGKYINPNQYTIGIEFAAGYDNDKDGKVEIHEKMWTEEQMQTVIWYLKTLENNPDVDIILDPQFIITHRDIASYKPDIEAWRDEILKRLNHNQKNMITYKKQNEPSIYVAVGTKLIPFATDWQSYQNDFKEAVIVELSPEEFNKFTIAQSTNIKSKS